MNKIFTIKYRINEMSFEINLQARDWVEAEAILACIKENGVISGETVAMYACPGVGFEDIRPYDSLAFH